MVLGYDAVLSKYIDVSEDPAGSVVIIIVIKYLPWWGSQQNPSKRLTILKYRSASHSRKSLCTVVAALLKH